VAVAEISYVLLETFMGRAIGPIVRNRERGNSLVLFDFII